MSIEKHTFDSGLQLYVDHVPTAHTTALNVIVGVGALDETDAEAGLSHLLEHCVHKKTAIFADNQERVDYESEHQYSSGANTSQRRTLYYGRGPQFDPMLQGLASMVATPSLTDEHILEEVAVVTREAKMGLDVSSARAYYAGGQLMMNSPYSRPVIGYWQQLDFSPDQVRDYYQKQYNLGRITVATSGAATLEQVVESANAHLESGPLADKQTGNSEQRYSKLPPIQPGEPGKYAVVTSDHSNVSIKNTHFLDKTTTKNMLNNKRFAHGVASRIIAESVAKSLREDRQLSYDGGYGLGTEGHPTTWGAGNYVTCEPHKIEEALEAFDEGVENSLDTSTKKIRAEILSAAGMALIGLDDIGSRAGSITGGLEVGLEPSSAEEIVVAYKSITTEEVSLAIKNFVDLYQTQDRYVLVAGDDDATRGYTIVEPKM